MTRRSGLREYREQLKKGSVVEQRIFFWGIGVPSLAVLAAFGWLVLRWLVGAIGIVNGYDIFIGLVVISFVVAALLAAIIAWYRRRR